jgi:hypothetical protein
MEVKIPFPAEEEIAPEEESMPISIRKLDRLETTHFSNPSGN